MLLRPCGQFSNIFEIEYAEIQLLYLNAVGAHSKLVIRFGVLVDTASRPASITCQSSLHGGAPLQRAAQPGCHRTSFDHLHVERFRRYQTFAVRKQHHLLPCPMASYDALVPALRTRTAPEHHATRATGALPAAMHACTNFPGDVRCYVFLSLPSVSAHNKLVYTPSRVQIRGRVPAVRETFAVSARQYVHRNVSGGTDVRQRSGDGQPAWTHKQVLSCWHRYTCDQQIMHLPGTHEACPARSVGARPVCPASAFQSCQDQVL